VELPYSAEVYFALLAEYNRASFPAAVLGPALGLAVLAWIWTGSPPGRARRAAGGIAALLAAAWAWVGWAHQLRYMAELDFLAPSYGAAWLAQAALFALLAARPGTLAFGFRGDLRGLAGLTVALLGLVGYPLALLSLGQDWRALPLVGAAPNPTALFTVGLLLAMRERPPRILFVIPLAWAVVAATSAYLLRFPLDYAVGAAIAAATLIGTVRPGRTPAASDARR